MKAPSPKERHRAGVVARCGMVCYARGHGECRGRLQAIHWIPAQSLREIQGNMRIAIKNGREVGEGRRYMVDMPLDGLVADDRNGAMACDHHHAAIDRRNGQALDLTPPQEVKDFAAEYGLEDWI